MRARRARGAGRTIGGGRTGGDARSGAPASETLDAAVRLLSARALSGRELRERLERRGFAPPAIEAALRSCLERGYLDDRALAYNVASSLATRRLYGRTRVAAELRRRGIVRDLIADAVKRVFAELDEEALAVRAAARLRRHAAGLEGERDRARIARGLVRRGFSRSAALAALRGAAAGRGRGSGAAGTADEESLLASIEPAPETEDDDDLETDA